MLEERNVPQIRFKGFTEPWEQRQLGDTVEVCSGRDYKHLPAGRIPVYGTGGYMTSVSAALSYARDAVGIGRKGTIDRPYKLVAPFWTVDTLFFSIPREGNDLDFLLGVFLRIDWKSKNEATGLPSLSKQTINEIEVFIPEATEQSRIGHVFAKLDNLITLHQRKLDKLKSVKKSLLEKTFPKPGSDVPEIRFAGFTDPWEQRQLGDTVEVCSGRDYKHLPAGRIPVYGTGGYMTSVSAALSYARDAVGIGRKGTIDRPYKLVAPFWTVDTLFFSIPREGNDLDFLLGVFLRIDWKSKNEATGLPSLSKQTINEIEVFIPEATEQSRIGHVFAKLDNLITLHQRKLDILGRIKKSLLEKMFV